MVTGLSKKLLGSPVIELDSGSDLIDTYSLCGSKHEAWIYVTDEDDDGIPNAQEDSIVVAFTGTDSSGAGCIDEVFETLIDVAKGSIIFVTDPEEWESTVETGLDIVLDRFDNCEGGWDCTKDGAAAVVYSGAYAVTTVVQETGKAIYSGVKKLKFWSEEETMRRSIFGAERTFNSSRSGTGQRGEVTTCKFWDSSKPDGSFLGTVYHNQNGDEHKVKITINKLYQGKTTTVYQSELAGGSDYKMDGNNLLFEPSFRKFKLNGPGTYTINVKSLSANMDCGNPALDLTTSVVVAESPDAGNKENTLSTLNEGVTEITEATGVRPLYIYGGAVLLGGLFVSKYLKLLSGSGDDDESE
jgi:hypothetical protein